MTQDSAKIPEPAALARLRDRLSEHPQFENSAAMIMVARAYLNLALASFAVPEITETLKSYWDEEEVIVVSPSQGYLDFNVPSHVGEFVHVMLKPDNFDINDPEQRREYEAYRALVDIIQRLPIGRGEAQSNLVGPFEVLCTEEDMPKWAAIWARWARIGTS